MYAFLFWSKLRLINKLEHFVLILTNGFLQWLTTTTFPACNWSRALFQSLSQSRCSVLVKGDDVMLLCEASAWMHCVISKSSSEEVRCLSISTRWRWGLTHCQIYYLLYSLTESQSLSYYMRTMWMHHHGAPKSQYICCTYMLKKAYFFNCIMT